VALFPDQNVTSHLRKAEARSASAARGPQARGRGFPRIFFSLIRFAPPDFHPVTRKSRASGTPAEVRGLQGPFFLFAPLTLGSSPGLPLVFRLISLDTEANKIVKWGIRSRARNQEPLTTKVTEVHGGLRRFRFRSFDSRPRRSLTMTVLKRDGFCVARLLESTPIGG
jgi:hypothetical protein